MAEMVRNIVEETCPQCNGRGHEWIYEWPAGEVKKVCVRCGGTGKSPIQTKDSK